jgi:hypothetical protein
MDICPHHASGSMIFIRREFCLDRGDFGSSRSKIMNVMDSNTSERDIVRKPLHTFRHRALAPPALLLLAGMLAACAMSDNENLSALMVSPGKYDFYKCDQIARQGKENAERAKELKGLMDRSAQGPGGQVANALAYRNEYLTAVGELRQLESAAISKKCEIPWQPISERSMW